jgi:hypothetical protein
MPRTADAAAHTTFRAPLSSNTTGVLRKLNPDNLDALVDVPLNNGRIIEISGRQAIALFNAVAANAAQRRDEELDRETAIRNSLPQVIGSLSFADVYEGLLRRLRDAFPDEADVTARANRYLAGRLLHVEEIDDRDVYAPLVLTMDGSLVTATVEMCARCKKKPYAEFRTVLGCAALDYQTGKQIATVDQEYVCDECAGSRYARSLRE